MKAAFIERTGPPEVICYGDLPDPTATGSKVLVRVEAVAVNPIDTYIRAGTVPMELPRPFIVGCDLAGVVEELGPDVAPLLDTEGREAFRLAKGDRVWCSNQGMFGRQGTFAQYAAIDACWLYPIPAGVASTDAAALALVGITAHLGLFAHGKLRKGEKVFVNGGSGGVGACVVQMAVAAGASVATTAGSEEKIELCRKLGAELVVDYRHADIDTALRQFGQIDLWFETRRDPDLELAVKHLAPRGRLILMAGREARPVFPLGPFYTRDCSAHGFAMFNATAEQQRRCATEINDLLARGLLKAVIGKILPLAETAQAHRLQEEKTLLGRSPLAGKIVLVPP